MKNRKLRSYTPEFRERAVKLCLESNKLGKEIAKDLGIPAGTLYHWVRTHRKQKKSSISDQAQTSSEVDEINRLKKELSMVQEERDILKKALAIVSLNEELNMP